MDLPGLSLVLSSWLRLEPDAVSGTMRALARAGLMPPPRTSLDASLVARGLIAVMLRGLGGAEGVAPRVAEASAMLLEGPKFEDPLNHMPRDPFSRLVGRSMGPSSANGYLDLEGTLGASMARYRDSLGDVFIEGLTLRAHGNNPSAVVAALDAAGQSYEYRFSPGGVMRERTGLYREVRVGRETLAGLAFAVSADEAREAGVSAPRPSQRTSLTLPAPG